MSHAYRSIPHFHRRTLPSTLRPFSSTSRATASSRTFLPRLLSPSTLSSILPFPRRAAPPGTTGTKPKEWNPYTFFIVAFLFVGSLSINHLALKHEHRASMLRAEARIDLLRETIERVQRGEDIDVEKALGTGVELEERGWEEVLKEIEEEDRSWNERKAARARRRSDVSNASRVTQETSTTPDGVTGKGRPVGNKVTADDYLA